MKRQFSMPPYHLLMFFCKIGKKLKNKKIAFSFVENAIVNVYGIRLYASSTAAWAAASLAIGTRNGEQDA